MNLEILRQTSVLFFLTILSTFGYAFASFQDPPGNSKTSSNATEISAEQFRQAAADGNIEKVKLGLTQKLDPESPSDYGVTALALACNHGHEEVVDILLAAGASPNAKDRFYRITPLAWALSKKRHAIVAKLVSAGIDDVEGALGTAIGMQDPKSLEILLESKSLTKPALVNAWRSAKKANASTMIELLEKRLPEEDRQMETPTSDPKTDLTIYVGDYKNESGTKLTVSSSENGLEVRAEESERGLQLSTKDGILFEARGITVTFRKVDDKVQSMVWKIGDMEQIYLRTTQPVASPAEPTEEPRPLPRDYSFDVPHWPGFRGTLARGISNGKEIAKEWDGETGKNIAWKVPIPGLATSSPIVWGKRVFLTTAIRANDTRGFRVGAYGDVESEETDGECQFVTLCLNLDTGAEIWRREACRAIPKVKRHAKSSHANPTPVCDGKRLICSFGGEGIYAYDLDGNLLWSRNLGMLDSGWFYDRTYQWGFGSSPSLFEDLVILQCDVQEGAFIVALDASTGEEKWRTSRDEIPTWSSPVSFVTTDGQETVVVAGTKGSAAYEARTGKKIWQLGGFSEIVVPTPQVTPDLVLLASGYAPVQPMVALSHSARGDLKMPEDKKGQAPFLWNTSRGGPYMPTPLIFEGRIYVLDNSGILSAYRLDSGKRIFRERIRSEEANAFTASPIARNGNLYLISEIGITFVVTMGDSPKVIATNKLGESVLATPAVADNKLLIRGEKSLFAISNEN